MTECAERRLRPSEAVPEEAPLRAGVGVVVVGDVAHVVVDVVLDGERLPGHLPSSACMCARCSAGGSVPWKRHTTIGTAQISHSAIQQTSSSWNHGVMRAASQRSQSSTLRELRRRLTQAPTATSCDAASTSRRTSARSPAITTYSWLRTCDTVPDALALRVVDPDLRADVATGVEREHLDVAVHRAHVAQLVGVDPRLVVVRHHHDAGAAPRRSRAASASGISRRRLNTLLVASSRASTRLHATP